MWKGVPDFNCLIYTVYIHTIWENMLTVNLDFGFMSHLDRCRLVYLVIFKVKFSLVSVNKSG